MMLNKSASLTPGATQIIATKATEAPFSGEYTDSTQAGTYLCRRCGLALFRAQTKFHSGCGWPSFDAEIAAAVARLPDADGKRVEILCARCDAHLGHVFSGENFTATNLRHCVNSASLDFVNNATVLDTQEAIFGAGCFWGVEYYFKKLPGVVKTEVGYTGGELQNPAYEQICGDATGHFEAVRVLFDPTQLSYESLARYFFEIHDPTQTDGQGPDHGAQYLSAVFYYDAAQQACIEQLTQQLTQQGLKVATQLLPVQPFWAAELYHQDYYDKTGSTPYCHRYVKRFNT